jgi:hypothetical protein
MVVEIGVDSRAQSTPRHRPRFISEIIIGIHYPRFDSLQARPYEGGIIGGRERIFRRRSTRILSGALPDVPGLI